MVPTIRPDDLCNIQITYRLLRGIEEGYRRGGAVQRASLREFDRRWPQIRHALDRALGGAIGCRDLDLLGVEFAIAAPRVFDVRVHAQQRITWMESARCRASDLGQAQEEAMLWGELGKAYAEIGRLQRAEECMRRRIEFATMGGDERGTMIGREHLGGLMLRRGDAGKAGSEYEAALALALRLEEHEAEIRIIGNLAMAYGRLGRLAEAIQLYERRLEILRTTGDSKLMQSTLQKLAQAHADSGDIDRAFDEARESLSLAESLKDKLSKASILGTMGNLHLDKGEPVQAVRCFSRAQQLFRSINNLRGEAKTSGSLGLAYWRIGQLDRSRNSLERAIELDRALHDRYDEAIDLANLAGVYASQGDTAKAEELSTERIRIARELSDPRGEAVSLWSLSQIWAISGEKKRAEALAREAFALFDAIGDQRQKADVEMFLASCLP